MKKILIDLVKYEKNRSISLLILFSILILTASYSFCTNIGGLKETKFISCFVITTILFFSLSIGFLYNKGVSNFDNSRVIQNIFFVFNDNALFLIIMNLLLVFSYLLKLGMSETINILLFSGCILLSIKRYSPFFSKESYWSFGIFMLSVSISILYLWIGWHSNGNIDNDAAYYFGVSKYMSDTMQFKEPIVWNFLSPPANIVHNPFDYWAGLTSTVLSIPLNIFGETYRVAAVFMALVSSLTLILFAYFIVKLSGIKSKIVQFATIYLFAFSGVAFSFRFDTETIPIVYFLIVVSIIFISQKKIGLSVLAICLIVYTRRDSVVISAILFSGVLWIALKEFQQNKYRKLKAAITMLTILIVIYLASNIIMFGSITPKPSSIAMRLGKDQFIYTYGVTPEFTWIDLAKKWLSFDYLSARLHFLIGRMMSLDFVNCKNWWYIWAIIPGISIIKRSIVSYISYASLTVGALLLVILTERVFHHTRTLSILMPFVVISGGYGLDLILISIEKWSLCSKKHRTIKRIAVGFLIYFTIKTTFIQNFKLYKPRAVGRYANLDLSIIDKTANGESVMSNTPFWIIANSKSPSVMFPENGEQAAFEIIKKYDVKWLMFIGGWSYGRSKPILRDIIRGSKKNIGNFKLLNIFSSKDIKIYKIE